MSVGTYPPVAFGVLRDLPNRLRRASQWEGGLLVDDGDGFPNQDVSYTLIVTDKLQQLPLWVGEV